MKFKDLLLKLKQRGYDNITIYPGEHPEVPRISKESEHLSIVFFEYYNECENWKYRNNIYHDEVTRNNDIFEKDCIDCLVDSGLSNDRALELFDWVYCLTQEKDKVVEYLIDLLNIFEKQIN